MSGTDKEKRPLAEPPFERRSAKQRIVQVSRLGNDPDGSGSMPEDRLVRLLEPPVTTAAAFDALPIARLVADVVKAAREVSDHNNFEGSVSPRAQRLWRALQTLDQENEK